MLAKASTQNPIDTQSLHAAFVRRAVEHRPRPQCLKGSVALWRIFSQRALRFLRLLIARVE
jgi:hypothetical protein